MSAEVETMFYLRKEPWHGLGTQVMEAPNSKEALKLAGLDWKVVQEPLITGAGDMVDGYKANVRNTDPVYLRLMVIESNSDPDKVRLEELLSDQVYLYERKTGKVRIA